MGRIAAKDSLAPDQRVEELGRIILAYSEVTERLQQSHDQLQQTVDLLRDELSEKNRLLERRNRLAALGEMAAGLAHEIRNPLGGINLYASMLAKDVADRPESLITCQKISAGVKRLEALVSQTLQFTREISANAVEMDLAVMVEQIVDLARPTIDAKQIALEIDGPVTLQVTADPNLLGQALLNLLLNAADATPELGRIITKFAQPSESSGAQQFQLVVHDSGPGISPAVLDRIFNPFFTTKETGTGLGLSVVHRVVEAHDGTIVVTNPPEGGARFEIRI